MIDMIIDLKWGNAKETEFRILFTVKTISIL